MFIKKDLRKINEILADEGDKREVMKLSKRAGEFDGSIRILTGGNEEMLKKKLDALSNLKTLNLYDNDITTVDDIGRLEHTPLEEINLGMNKLSILPLDFGKLVGLRRVWLEDNDFEEFPLAICQLKSLEELRMSGNRLKNVPANLGSLAKLESLCLDNNEIESFPLGVLQLTSLKSLWLRQNHITELPDNLDALSNLELFSLSSNKISTLPTSITRISTLKKLFINGNMLKELPEGLCQLLDLIEVNIANNQIKALPESFQLEWGTFDRPSGKLKHGIKEIQVTVAGNPFTKAKSYEMPQSIGM